MRLPAIAILNVVSLLLPVHGVVLILRLVLLRLLATVVPAQVAAAETILARRVVAAEITVLPVVTDHPAEVEVRTGVAEVRHLTEVADQVVIPAEAAPHGAVAVVVAQVVLLAPEVGALARNFLAYY